MNMKYQGLGKNQILHSLHITQGSMGSIAE